MRKTVIIPFFLLFASTAAHGAVIGTQGNLYSIAEKDAAQEVEERMASIDWKKVLNERRLRQEAETFRPAGTKNLPAAKVNRLSLVDMTYTLDYDIPDKDGGVLYPKGFTFNPLDYMSYPFTIVVIDGSDRSQIAWFKGSSFAADMNVKLFLTAGSAQTVAGELNRPADYADGLIIKRFQLHAVPSIVKQHGKYMEVREVAIHAKK